MNLTFTTNNSNGQESYRIPLDAKQLLLKGAKLKIQDGSEILIAKELHSS